MVVSKIGVYKVSIKLNANNETRIVSKELNVSVLSSIYSKPAINGIKIFPNPAFDVVNVLSDNLSANTGYSISDLSGKTVLSGRIKNGSDKININMLSAGTYTLAINSECIKVIKSK